MNGLFNRRLHGFESTNYLEQQTTRSTRSEKVLAIYIGEWHCVYHCFIFSVFLKLAMVVKDVYSSFNLLANFWSGTSNALCIFYDGFIWICAIYVNQLFFRVFSSNQAWFSGKFTICST